jgi:hypothetical protein
MGPIGSFKISVSKQHTPRTNSEDETIHFNSGGSLRSLHQLFICTVQSINETALASGAEPVPVQSFHQRNSQKLFRYPAQASTVKGILALEDKTTTFKPTVENRIPSDATTNHKMTDIFE